jgi:hypothetical protein
MGAGAGVILSDGGEIVNHARSARVHAKVVRKMMRKVTTYPASKETG